MSQTKIHVLHTGSVNVDRALPFKEKTLHPLPFSGWLRPKSWRMWVPVSAYLIEHPKGLILIDAGWHEDMRVDVRKHLGFLASTMITGILPPGQSIREQLQRLGYTDKDLDLVIMTHLHSDHVSGLKQVAGAKRVIVSDLEWNAAQKDGNYIKSMWEGVNMEKFEMKSIPHGPYKKGLDLFGDGTIYLVLTPGHSVGMVSLLVKTDDGWVLLGSDVGYARKSWEQHILPGVTTSVEEADKSLRWLGEFSKRDDCRMVIVNHDLEIAPQIIT
ncbi:N-acyl homoserine lactonase family protein [Paenibacillus durus]|uniref:Beta-lactamase n=1 Tax=Paenibacillus durus ATCC 35681 TaxID=1333534 RepID=A0A0F7FEJ8_PAEDU|nr:N-acyl homoserine lactonase family protein [Paenibacillus durus]AKG37335.1 beta-lactamase [Paenibacillus durus ATCC 35681]